MAYKPDQGRLARMAVFWMLWLLVVYGCMSFRHWMNDWSFLPGSMKEELFRLPVLGEVTFVVLICLVAIPALTAWLFLRFLSKPKIADFLIETETELRKVAWPSFQETRGASVVVIICVLVLMGFLFGADVLLSALLDKIWAMAPA